MRCSRRVRRRARQRIPEFRDRRRDVATLELDLDLTLHRLVTTDRLGQAAHVTAFRLLALPDILKCEHPVTLGVVPLDIRPRADQLTGLVEHATSDRLPP